MSFFSIADPEERERVVKDYKRLKREIQKRDENRKISGQNRYRSLKETFNPVVKAQEDMAEKIVTSLKEIRPVKEEKFLMPSKKRRLSSEDEFGSLADAYRNRYMSRDDEIDTSFGIKFADGVPYIASTPIKIDHDDITICNEVYEGTPGLWSLITEKQKECSKEVITQATCQRMKEFYVRQMFYIKISIRILLIQEVVHRGNGKIFLDLFGKKCEKNLMRKKMDMD